MDQTQKQALDAVARAAATGSLMIVRQTAARIAAANGITDRERIDYLARFVIAEGGRLGVDMEPGSRELSSDWWRRRERLWQEST